MQMSLFVSERYLNLAFSFARLFLCDFSLAIPIDLIPRPIATTRSGSNDIYYSCTPQQTRVRSANVILRIPRTNVRKQRVSLGLQKRAGNIGLRIRREHIQERVRDANAKLRVSIKRVATCLTLVACDNVYKLVDDETVGASPSERQNSFGFPSRVIESVGHRIFSED